MKNSLLIKNVYTEAFKGFKNIMLKHAFKAFSWACFGLFGVILYAFIYRIATGFAF